MTNHLMTPELEKRMAETDQALAAIMETVMQMNETVDQLAIIRNKSFFERLKDSNSILSQVVQSLEDLRR